MAIKRIFTDTYNKIAKGVEKYTAPFVTVDSLICQLKYGKCGLNEKIYFEKINNQKVELLTSVSKVIYKVNTYDTIKFEAKEYDNYFVITSTNSDLVDVIEFSYILFGRYICG